MLKEEPCFFKIRRKRYEGDSGEAMASRYKGPSTMIYSCNIQKEWYKYRDDEK
jgi:hypothetical protein